MTEKHYDKRVEFTKMLLRESLIKLLYDKPIQKITITELCKVAGVNRGTFYAHFSSRYELLHYTEDMEFDTISGYILAIISEKDRYRLRLCCNKLFLHIEKYAHFWRALLSENISCDFSKRLVERIHKNYLSNTKMPEEEQLRLKLIFTYMFTGGIGLAACWLNDYPALSPEYMGDILLCVLEGQLTPFTKNK